MSPVPTPEPVAIGEPGAGYPLPWTVQTWLPGHNASVEDPAGSSNFAADLAALITALRTANTRGRRVTGEGRGGHLTDHDGWMETCFRNSEGLKDAAMAAVQASPNEARRRMRLKTKLVREHDVAWAASFLRVLQQHSPEDR